MAELRGSATLTASSEYNASLLKGNAVDGNTATEWASASEQYASWIQFTWGSPVTIREIRLLPRPGDSWGIPKFIFSDASYANGYPYAAANADITYVLLCPKTTTSLRVGIDTNQTYTGVATGVNAGFKEVYINDAYSGTPPSTNLTTPSSLTAVSSFNAAFSKWYILDGNTANEWASSGAGSGAWIQFNYTSAVYITSIQLRDRAGAERWGTPRFTFDDASTQDGGGAVSNTGYTTYTLGTPKVSTSLRVSIASGSSGNNLGLAEAIITGNVTVPSASRLPGTAIQIIG